MYVGSKWIIVLRGGHDFRRWPILVLIWRIALITAQEWQLHLQKYYLVISLHTSADSAHLFCSRWSTALEGIVQGHSFSCRKCLVRVYLIIPDLVGHDWRSRANRIWRLTSRFGNDFLKLGELSPTDIGHIRAIADDNHKNHGPRGGSWQGLRYRTLMCDILCRSIIVHQQTKADHVNINWSPSGGLPRAGVLGLG